VPVKEDEKPCMNWIEGFDNGKGKSQNIEPKVACYLELERLAFEEKIEEIKKRIEY